MKWLKNIARTKAPTLICLTFGDQLFAEKMEALDKFPDTQEMKRIVKGFVEVS